MATHQKAILACLVVAHILCSGVTCSGAVRTPEAVSEKRDVASEQFMAWQTAMFQERQEIARKQLRLFHQHMKVPPPLPDSEPEPAPRMMRIDVPLPFPTDQQMTFQTGEPTASFQVKAEGKALSFIGASYSAGVSYSASDNKWLVGDSADFSLALENGPVEIAGTYQYHASTWNQPAQEDNPGDKTGSVGISADLLMVNGALAYNTKNELTASVGYDLLSTPEAFSHLAQASLGVTAEVSAPVQFQGLTQDKRSLSGALMTQVARVVKLLTTSEPCPHCEAQGELDCPTCANTRTIACTQCNGKLRFTCTRCEGGGQLYCGTCDGTMLVTCGSCSGSGQLRCSTCRGSGQVTTYESEMRERQELVIDQLGFDDAGNPIYNRHYETRYETVQVPKNQTCASCSGSGNGGECGTCGGDGKVSCTRCGGDGTVDCHICKGKGWINCAKCRGTGRVTCPDCHGKAIRCPLCKGKKQLGK